MIQDSKSVYETEICRFWRSVESVSLGICQICPVNDKGTLYLSCAMHDQIYDIRAAIMRAAIAHIRKKVVNTPSQSPTKIGMARTLRSSLHRPIRAAIPYQLFEQTESLRLFHTIVHLSTKDKKLALVSLEHLDRWRLWRWA